MAAARNQSESHPPDSILLVGSSSIRLWKTIASDMAPYDPIERGYGGAKFSDLAVFADRLISPHRFRALVLFAGNDVTGGCEDATPEEVAGWLGHIMPGCATDRRLVVPRGMSPLPLPYRRRSMPSGLRKTAYSQGVKSGKAIGPVAGAVVRVSIIKVQEQCTGLGQPKPAEVASI